MFSFFRKKRTGQAEHRPLTEDESHILGLVQRIYGAQNTDDKCIIVGKDEAVIFAEVPGGMMPICVNLTNVAEFGKMDGLSDEEIMEQWLKPRGEEEE